MIILWPNKHFVTQPSWCHQINILSPNFLVCYQMFLLKTLVSHVTDNFWKWLVDAIILMWSVIQFRKRRSQSLTDIKYWEKVKPLETQVFQMDWKKCDAWGLYGQKASNLWLDHTGNAQLNYLSKCDCEYDRSQPKIIYRLKHALSILEFCYVSHVPPGMFTCEFVKGKAMEKVAPLSMMLVDLWDTHYHWINFFF